MRRPRFAQVARTALTTLLLGGSAIRSPAEIVDIRWDSAQAFAHRQLLAPGRFAELCGPLARGQIIVWSFKADAPQDFNIHYHEGKDVVYPEQRKQVAEAEGRLEVALDQSYCWMWSNKSDMPVALQVSLQRR
ncbi:MAG TPA: hypothetical protein VJN44_10325 [Roseateles sp.]|nr:hypothetical protein [Roseateles sp.]